MAPLSAMGKKKRNPSGISLAFDMFPDSLHSVLKEIDEEGSGTLEMNELTDIFTQYAEMKRAQRSGAISMPMFSPQVRKVMEVFDDSGDGMIEPSELARAANLYDQSKKTGERLIKLALVLLLLIGALLGCLAGITIMIVEEAKEQETDSTGVCTVKGEADKPVATATVTNSTTIKNALTMTPTELKAVKSFDMPIPAQSLAYGYTITGYTKMTDEVMFYTAHHHVITVTATKFKITDKDCTTNADCKLIMDSDVSRRRRLQRRRQLLRSLMDSDGSDGSDSNSDSDDSNSDDSNSDDSNSDSDSMGQGSDDPHFMGRGSDDPHFMGRGSDGSDNSWNMDDNFVETPDDAMDTFKMVADVTTVMPPSR